MKDSAVGTDKIDDTNSASVVEDQPEEYAVVCYFTNWATYRQGIGKFDPEDIDEKLCTHIVYGFAVLNPETMLIRPHDDWADNGKGKIETKGMPRGV